MILLTFKAAESILDKPKTDKSPLTFTELKLKFRVAELRLTIPRPDPKSGLRVKSNPNPPAVILAFILMSLSAFIVKETKDDDVLAINGVFRFIFPASRPPEPVEITTEVFRFKAAVIRSTPNCAESAIDANGLAALIPTLPAPATISILFGSISHSPPLPLTAVASGTRVMSRFLRPEVSTNPPSPPFAPPLAVTSPCTCTSFLAKTMTLPPFPLSVAST